MVPLHLKNAIWRHYRAGQERDWKPSPDYLRAARAAVVWVAEKEGLEPNTELYDFFLGGDPSATNQRLMDAHDETLRRLAEGDNSTKESHG
jgi:hypothetical protein